MTELHFHTAHLRRSTLVILAAGMGTRYGGLKQIDPLGPSGEIILDYSVFDAQRAGFAKVVFVIRKEIEGVFRERIGSSFEDRVEVRYVLQDAERLPVSRRFGARREKPWGTGHAVWCAASAIDGPFAVINADDFYGADAFWKLRHFLQSVSSASHPAEGCMIGYHLVNTLSEFGPVSRGFCNVDSSGCLETVRECTGIERAASDAHYIAAGEAKRLFRGDETVSMNCWGFTPAFLPLLEGRLAAFLERGPGPKCEFYLPTAVTELIRAEEMRIQVLHTQATWFGVTYRDDRSRVAAALAGLTRDGFYPKTLRGVSAGASLQRDS